jgi:4a-hydroxytetrahydrobiopterin dehydratase
MEGMASQAKLPAPQIQSALAGLPGWKIAGEKLHREYEFADFAHAFGFMATAAVMIEALGHHPDWFNSYNRVVIDLSTHSAGGITARDLELAGKLEEIAKRLQ